MENNRSIADMDLEDFTDVVDAGGIFRGFLDRRRAARPRERGPRAAYCSVHTLEDALTLRG